MYSYIKNMIQIWIKYMHACNIIYVNAREGYELIVLDFIPITL